MTGADRPTPDLRECSECGERVQMLWNLGRCLECHEKHALFPLTGDVPPAGFDPSYAGEQWSEDIEVKAMEEVLDRWDEEDE